MREREKINTIAINNNKKKVYKNKSINQIN